MERSYQKMVRFDRIEQYRIEETFVTRVYAYGDSWARYVKARIEAVHRYGKADNKEAVY